MKKTQTSTYRGVRVERNQYRADIYINGRKKFLGYYKSETAAAQAYDNAVGMYNLNRPLNFPTTVTPPQATQVATVAPAAPAHTPLSGRSAFFRAMGITTASVEVRNDHLVTLEGAVTQTVNELLQNKNTFSAYDVTVSVRANSNVGNWGLLDCPFEYDAAEGCWIQKVEHSAVRDLVHDLYEGGRMGSYHRKVTTKVGSSEEYFVYYP